MWFTEVPEIVIHAPRELSLFTIRLPVPVVPPDTVNIFVPALLVRVVAVACTVKAPEIVSAEVVLFSVMPVTFAPMPPLMVTVPVLEPVLVIVPVLLNEVVLIVTVDETPKLLMVTLPVPVIPPLMVIPPLPVLMEIARSIPLRAKAPLKVMVAAFLLMRLTDPTALVPKVIALDIV